MSDTFDKLAGEAKAGKKSAVRAVQAWLYLIGKASNRQIIRYEELRQLLGYPTCQPVTQVLSCIMHYCEKRKMPPLTIIVVNKSGQPGPGFTAAETGVFDREREKVFEFNWFGIVPPTIEQLHNP